MRQKRQQFQNLLKKPKKAEHLPREMDAFSSEIQFCHLHITYYKFWAFLGRPSGKNGVQKGKKNTHFPKK